MAKTKAKKPKKDMIETKRATRYLKVMLTEQEVLDAGQSLVENMNRLDAINSELDAIKESFKARIKQCDADINTQRRLTQDKFKFCDVNVTEEWSFTACTLMVVRDDTFVTVEDRKLQGDEKQLNLAFVE